MAESGYINPDTSNNRNQELKASIEKWSKLTFNISQLPQLVQEIRSNDRFLQHHGVIGIKKLSSRLLSLSLHSHLHLEKPYPFQEVIDTGIVPTLIRIMQNDEETCLQADATKIVTGILQGNEKDFKAVIDLGVLPVLIKLLKSPSISVLNMTAFSLGYLANYSTIYRDMILNIGGLALLINILATLQDFSLIENTTFAISSLCKGDPAPNVQIVSQAIPVLCAVVKKETDSNALLDALTAIASFSEEISQIQPVIATGVVPSLIKHLQSADYKIAYECLKILGTITTGDKEQTTFLISFSDFLRQLFQLAQSKNFFLRRAACWIISNITAGTPDQANIIVKNSEYVSILIHVATTDDLEVQRQAVWALANATGHGNSVKITKATKMSVFDCFVNSLSNKDSQLVEVALEGVDNLVQSGNAVTATNNPEQNKFVMRLKYNGGIEKLEKLEKLKAHPNPEISERVLHILKACYTMEEDA